MEVHVWIDPCHSAGLVQTSQMSLYAATTAVLVLQHDALNKRQAALLEYIFVLGIALTDLP